MSTKQKYQDLTALAFEKTVIKGKASSILVFGADWSGNSEIMHSMMERVSEEFNSGILFYKVDVDESEDITSFFGVVNVPTTVMIKDGEVVEFMKGYVPAKKMRNKISEVYLEH